MANILDRFLELIGIEPNTDDEEERDDYYRENRDDFYQPSRSHSGGRSDRGDRDEREDRKPRKERYAAEDRYERDARESRSSRYAGRDRDDDYFEPEEELPRRRSDGGSSRSSARQRGQEDRDRQAMQASNAGSLPISGGQKMLVLRPISYDETQIVIDNLRNRKPVIVNLEELDDVTALRVLDFLAGAVYAIYGKMKKISCGVFVVAPPNYELIANSDDYGA